MSVNKQPSRIFEKTQGGWYYTKRGHEPQGPYPTRLAAQRALDRHIRGCRVRMAHSPMLFSWPRPWNPMRLMRKSGLVDAAGPAKTATQATEAVYD